MLKLKEIRNKKGISQKQLAEYLGVNQISISRYETEQRKLDQDSIVKLALYLEVTTDELLGFDEAYKEYVNYLLEIEKTEQEN